MHILCYNTKYGGVIMAIQKDNIRIMVTISREENEKLKKVADEENRSVSNLASTLIKNYLKDK